jgi:transposase-like protein
MDHPQQFEEDQEGYERWCDERDLGKPKCPQCGSRNTVVDGDYVEPLEHPDRQTGEGYFLTWWHCKDCDNQWRFQDEQSNPHISNAKD